VTNKAHQQEIQFYAIQFSVEQYSAHHIAAPYHTTPHISPLPCTALHCGHCTIGGRTLDIRCFGNTSCSSLPLPPFLFFLPIFLADADSDRRGKDGWTRHTQSLCLILTASISISISPSLSTSTLVSVSDPLLPLNATCTCTNSYRCKYYCTPNCLLFLYPSSSSFLYTVTIIILVTILICSIIHFYFRRLSECEKNNERPEKSKFAKT
jgi:hypothetical protein